MNSDTAELATVDAERELVAPFEPSVTDLRSADAASRWWTRHLANLRSADPARMAAAHDSWRALWSSRMLVWAAGMGTLLAFGFGPVRHAFNPPGVTRGFGWLGDLLAAPAARWDASWYLVIAHYGYRPELGPFTSSRTAFFPLYPLGLKTITWFGLPVVLAGVLLSLFALGLALYGIHRLTTLRAGTRWPISDRAHGGGRRGAPGSVAHGVCADGILLFGGLL